MISLYKGSCESKESYSENVPSYENIADVFTKPLGRICFERCVRKLFG